MAKWLPFAKAENVYFSVFISFIFFIFILSLRVPFYQNYGFG
ncbi:putative membrane protein [Acinetobacter baumannii 1457504]|nr:putative membrane protein [Acinetobacter baumannii 1457504]